MVVSAKIIITITISKEEHGLTGDDEQFHQ